MQNGARLTPAYVIEALGGVHRVAKLAKTTHRAVYNWRNTKFPANTYCLLQEELRRYKLVVPDHLWAMRGLRRR